MVILLQCGIAFNTGIYYVVIGVPLCCFICTSTELYMTLTRIM